MVRAALFSILAILMLPTASAAAERCGIEYAVYAEADAGSRLTFRPVGEDAAAVSHLFGVTGGTLKLDGHIMYDEDGRRPSGMIMNNCPEGDVTGDDIRACTVWTGIPYALDVETGQIDILGPAGSQAPDAILMPGLGPAIRHSALWDKSSLKDVPWDLYEFRECKAQ